MSKVLLSSDCHDYATTVGKNLISNYVEPYFRQKGYEVYTAYCSQARRDFIHEILERYNPLLFAGCGHGNENIYTGWMLEYVFWTCDCSGLSGKGVYLLSCLTAVRLGHDIIQKGGKAYSGYYVEFTWVVGEPNTDPYGDPYQASFFRPVERMLKALADGKTIRQAVDEQIEQFNIEIEYWRNSNDPYAPYVIYYLTYDRDGIRLYGDETWRLRETKEIKPYVTLLLEDAASVERREVVAARPIDYRIPLAVGGLLTLGAAATEEEERKRAMVVGAIGATALALYLYGKMPKPLPSRPREVVKVESETRITVEDRYVEPIQVEATSTLSFVETGMITPARPVRPSSAIILEDTALIGEPIKVEGSDGLDVSTSASILVGVYLKPRSVISLSDVASIPVVRKNIRPSSSISLADVASASVTMGVAGSDTASVSHSATIIRGARLRPSSSISLADTASASVTKRLNPSSSISLADTASTTVTMGVAGTDAASVSHSANLRSL